MKPRLIATVEQWKEIGDQTKKIREELFNLANISAGKMPVSITDYIVEAIDKLDSFRCKAEDRMMETGVSKDLKVFYK